MIKFIKKRTGKKRHAITGLTRKQAAVIRWCLGSPQTAANHATSGCFEKTVLFRDEDEFIAIARELRESIKD